MWWKQTITYMFRAGFGYISQSNLFTPLYCDASRKKYVLHLALQRKSYSPNTKWKDRANTAIRLQNARSNSTAMHACFSCNHRTTNRLNRRTVLNMEQWRRNNNGTFLTKCRYPKRLGIRHATILMSYVEMENNLFCALEQSIPCLISSSRKLFFNQNISWIGWCYAWPVWSRFLSRRVYWKQRDRQCSRRNFERDPYKMLFLTLEKMFLFLLDVNIPDLEVQIKCRWRHWLGVLLAVGNNKVILWQMSLWRREHVFGSC